MAIEYKLSYTADDINNKLGKIEQLSQDVANLKTNADANTVISNHNMSSTAHEDIRELIDNIIVPTKVGELTNDSGYLISIPSEYITETELNNKGYLTEHQSLDGYAKTVDIPTKVSELSNDSGFLTSVPSEYITETELNNKGYLTSIPSEYVTDSELNAKGYLTEHQDLTNYAKTTDIPTKTSQLTNDSGYLTSYTETDPTVPAWAKASTKPTYTASEVGADPSGSASAVQSNLDTHTNNKSNPHGVTAAQVGALPSSGGTMTGSIDFNGSTQILDFGTTGYFRGRTSSGNMFDMFALINSTRFRVGGTYPTLEFVGKNDRPTYNDSDVALVSDVPSKTETWTFTLEDGSTVTKVVYVG